MVVFKPEPIVIEHSLSADLMWLFIRAGRVSFTDFIDTFGAEKVALFVEALDDAGLQVVMKKSARGEVAG